VIVISWRERSIFATRLASAACVDRRRPARRGMMKETNAVGIAATLSRINDFDS
jgi:hypothetical protein